MPSNDDLLECPICLSTYTNPYIIVSCAHTFCKNCLDSLRDPKCPICRKPFNENRKLPNYALTQLLQSNFPTAPFTASQAPAQPSSAAASNSSRDEDLSDEELDRRAMHLVQDGHPYGLAQMVVQESELVALRIYLLDNSGSCSAPDGKFLFADTRGHMREEECTRWEEIKHMAMEQADFNAKVGTPAEFHILNPPAGQPTRSVGVDFVRVDSSQGPVEQQIVKLQKMLGRTQPGGVTPLVNRLGDIFQHLRGLG